MGGLSTLSDSLEVIPFLPQLCARQSKTLGILQPWMKLGLLLIEMRENIHGGARGEGPDCVLKRTKLERSHQRTWALARRFAEESKKIEVCAGLRAVRKRGNPVSGYLNQLDP